MEGVVEGVCQVIEDAEMDVHLESGDSGASQKELEVVLAWGLLVLVAGVLLNH